MVARAHHAQGLHELCVRSVGVATCKGRERDGGKVLRVWSLELRVLLSKVKRVLKATGVGVKVGLALKCTMHVHGA